MRWVLIWSWPERPYSQRGVGLLVLDEVPLLCVTMAAHLFKVE
jgi:hypothetical protein